MLDRLRGHMRRHWFFNLVQVIAVATMLYWWRHLPATGYAIGVLAVIAAVMSVHGEMRPWQKVIWMLLVGAFLFLEFRAINKDRADFAKAEADRVAKEHQQFQTIAVGVKETIANSDRQFAATMSRFNETLNTLTGDGSYCYFTFNFGGTPALVHRGKYTLYDLHANFLDAKQGFIYGTEWLLGSPMTIGDFADGSARHISGLHKPSNLNSTDQLNLTIFFGARNGFWREDYRGRYVGAQWVEAIRVFKQSSSTAPFWPKYVLIFEKIDKRFPRDKNGRVAWY